MAEISLKEYANKYGIDPSTARQRALRGAFRTAHKVGRDWVIDEDEPLVDHRYSGSDKKEVLFDYIVMYHYDDPELGEFEDVQASSEQAAVDFIRQNRSGSVVTEVFRKVYSWQ